MRKIILALMLIIVLFSAGCASKEEQPLCKSPYFEYKQGDCCLDKDYNQICDLEEKSQETSESAEISPDGVEKPLVHITSPNNSVFEVPENKYCGNGICQANESCTSCAYDCACNRGYMCRPDGQCSEALTNERFSLHIGDGKGEKLGSFATTAIGSNVNFFVWVSNRKGSSVTCNYTRFVNGMKAETGELRLDSYEKKYIMDRVTVPAYLDTKQGAKVISYLIQCSEELAEISYTVKYS